MLTASCHCGAVKVQVPRKPRRLTNCNCSICRRYGVLWAYYKDADVQLTASPGATDDYVYFARVAHALALVRLGRLVSPVALPIPSC